MKKENNIINNNNNNIKIINYGEDKLPNISRIKNIKENLLKPLRLTEDLSDNGIIDSIVLTDNKIYLSAISSSTLQKRVNQNLIYNNGGNNG